MGQKDKERKEDRTEVKLSGWRKVVNLWHEDTNGFHPRLLALSFVTGLLPAHRAGLTRAKLFSLAGFRIGEGTRFAETPKINGEEALYQNLIVGRDCRIGAGCVFDLAERITIGDRVTIGHGVMLLTSTHELDIREHRAGHPQLIPVSIGDGAWLGPRVLILPGVKIGEGAIIEAGAVVNKDVAPHTRVGGIPAAPIATLKPTSDKAD
jgi:maltose O-acetyltransferase